MAVQQQVVGALSTLMPKRFGRIGTHAFLRPRTLTSTHRWPEAFAGFTQACLKFAEGSLRYWYKGQGPCVLLVHGWERDHQAMGGFVDALLARGYRVASFDLPGHGVSIAHAAALPNLARAIACVAEAVEAVAVIAHSVGAAMTARALDTHSLALNAVVLLSSPSGAAAYAEQLARQQGLSARARGYMLEGIERQLDQPMSTYQVGAALNKSSCAQLIVHAKDDALIPVSAAQANALHPKAQCWLLEAGGHNKLLGDRLLIEQVIDWLSQTLTPIEG